MTAFLFVHGWSFDRSFWDALLLRLRDYDCYVRDRGYWGGSVAEAVPPPGYVAVGHSAGVMDLLGDLPPGCAGLIAINGFTRFAAAEQFPGVPHRLLDRMIARLDEVPGETVAAFRARLGAEAALPADVEAGHVLQQDRLREGLVALRDGDLRDRLSRFSLPFVALGGAEDPLVSPAMTAASFGSSAILRPDGGHLLPLTDPDWCAGHLREFIR